MKNGLKEVYLDSNILIAFFVEEHPCHDIAYSVMEGAVGHQSGEFSFCVSFLTLDEVIYALSHAYKFPMIDIKRVILQLASKRGFRIAPIKSTLSTVTKYLDWLLESKIDPRDCLHLLIMQQNSICTLATFDKDLVKKVKKFLPEKIKFLC
jgi:predicted nucleic acid-binding protein